eukprot:4672996-Pleurochrysis_carterae.AAC.1
MQHEAWTHAAETENADEVHRPRAMRALTKLRNGVCSAALASRGWRRCAGGRRVRPTGARPSG